MNTYVTIILVIFSHIGICKDFYVGMFKKNDLLVAQDRLYKEKVPFRTMYAKYGRVFNCKITYFRVVDRLGFGPGPKVQIIRGGLGHKYLVLRMISPYNMPISVNIYVGCANIFTTTTITTKDSIDVANNGITLEEGNSTNTANDTITDSKNTTATNSTDSKKTIIIDT